MRFLLGLIVASWGWLGCANGPEPTGEPATYGRENGLVWVSGPWEAIRPSTDVDEVIDQLCPAIMKMPRAKDEDSGREYCGIIYSLGDGIYYASHPSSLGRPQEGRVSAQKSCYIPRSVRDARGQIVPLGDYHSHPWTPSPSSRQDRQSESQIYSVRVQFDTGCNLHKLIPYLNEDRPGELYVRHGKGWKLIGLINSEDKASGRITVVQD